MVGWVFFRAETLGGALAFLKAMAGASPAAPTPYGVTWYLTPELWLALTAGVIGSAPVVSVTTRWLDRPASGRARHATTWNLAATAALGVLLVAAITQIAARTYNPFIYFRF